jgi:FAD/FMN-containing dehydrogenase
MATLRIATAGGTGYTTIDARETSRLEQALTGNLLRPSSDGYDAARQIWNAMVDRRPALIARCRSVADVQLVVGFARDNHLLLSVRGGGHNIAGNAVCEGGVVLDLSEMRGVSVDPKTRVARVEGGATLAELDQATQAHGLATPVGINSTTGIAGLTLGGGFGWLSRKHGMTVDNLVAADIVTADGALLRASEHENPNLFWALRGGGGNFGVVTHFEFKLHPVGPEVLSGLIVYPASSAGQILRRYREAAEALSEDTSAWVIMRKAPPLPFLAPDVHGTDIVVIAVMHVGNAEAGRRAIEPLRKLGTPVGEHLGVQPFTAWQQAFDPLLTSGARNYWKSHNFLQLDDGLLDVLVEQARSLPSAECEVFIGQLGCQTNRVAADATAYPHRDARYVMNVHGRWRNAADDDAGIRWARGLYRAAAPFATGGVYVNFLTSDETDRVRAAYGPNYERLVAAKQIYDRGNLFNMNQNIQPDR